MEYISRIVDDVIDRKTEAFNAVSITGPKGCGKTRDVYKRQLEDKASKQDNLQQKRVSDYRVTAS